MQSSADHGVPLCAPVVDAPVKSGLSPESFCCHIFLLHDAMCGLVNRIVFDINALTALAPDAHLDDLRRRVEHLSEILTAHCDVEDKIVLPQIRAAMDAKGRRSSQRLDSFQPPMKRPRNSSPVAVDLYAMTSDHDNLHYAFDRLKLQLDRMRAAPILRHQITNFSAPSPFTSDFNDSYSLPPSVDGIQLTRRDTITHVCKAATDLAARVHDHFRNEEHNILPVSASVFTADQRGALLIRVINAIVSERIHVTTFRLVSNVNLCALLTAVAQYTTKEEVERVAIAIAKVLPNERWTSICKQLPDLKKLVVPKQDPLLAVLHMHKAIRENLLEIVSYCENLDPAHFKQMQTLAMKFNFLRRVHSCHAAGEEGILFKELYARLDTTSTNSLTELLHTDHDDEEQLFTQFANKQAQLESEVARLGGNAEAQRNLKQSLIACIRDVSSHLIEHMSNEETKILPLVRKHFSLDEQEKLMRAVSDKIPPELMQEVLPWIFNSLDVNEQESMLRNLLRTTPRDEIKKVIGSIAKSVNKGLTEQAEWREICLRIPEIEEEYQATADRDEEDIGPVSEILRVHKAFRVELNVLLRRCKKIPADGTIPNPRSLVSLAQFVAFLRKMVMDHSEAEDNIILPRMEERVPGISEAYRGEHCDERKLFYDLAQCLQELQCVADESDCTRLVQKLHGLAQTLRDEMVSHLEREERDMWPVLRKHFTVEEQSEIVALIFGQMSADQLREFLPWLIRILSVCEGSIMMNHILQVTQSTLFESWLKTWLPLDDKRGKKRENVGGADSMKKQLSRSQGGAGSSSDEPNSGNYTEGAGTTAAIAMLNGKKTMKETIREIAADSNLTVEDRTRMMQQVMLAPYNQMRSKTLTSRRDEGSDDRSKTYGKNKHGEEQLGCQHYLRACKLRADCCGKLYTCRLCHDDAEQTHIMDRYATKEILCMRCDTLQAVSGRCQNKACAQVFSRYFCEVCKFFDNCEGRKIYHCHSCNVCRAGRGLGKDYFHCMKCNQCMSMKYRFKGHRCVERAMESDCPVCNEFLFTSTKPVKYLSCGHLMHRACFEQFERNNGMRCPMCYRSLDSASATFHMIDRQLRNRGFLNMPSAYGPARCDVFCFDCRQFSNRPLNFMFNRCLQCSSYNTRVENVDPNGGSPGAGTSQSRTT